MTAGDRAGKIHWDSTWASQTVPDFERAHGSGRWNHVNREFAKLLRRSLTHPPGTALVELGCARSIWLPYCAKNLGYEVTGVDYSEKGCALARASLSAAGVHGRIVQADFFSPPAELCGSFQAGMSFGVAEHFEQTSECIAAFARFLADGGRLVTVIPNMTGVPGFLQKSLNRPVYEKHVPLGAAQLDAAHRAAGLIVRESGYLVSTNFGVLNLHGLAQNRPSWAVKRAFVAALARISSLGWKAEKRLPTLPTWAAYVYCVADRPSDPRSAIDVRPGQLGQTGIRC